VRHTYFLQLVFYNWFFTTGHSEYAGQDIGQEIGQEIGQDIEEHDND
jgi:hypothetical protein